MTQTADIVRRRRREQLERRGKARLGGCALALVALVLLSTGVAGGLLGFRYLLLSEPLPPVERIEPLFQDDGTDVFIPTRIFDRQRAELIFELIHPGASARRWLGLTPEAEYSIPTRAVQATIAAVDPSFESGKAVAGQSFSDAIGQLVGSPAAPSQAETIAERLIESTLLTDGDPNPALRSIQREILAGELTDAYSPEQILTWYINSAHYGNYIFGLDAASLVYFDQHAETLSFGEHVFLAAMAADPTLDPYDDRAKLQSAMEDVLASMVELGYIESSQMRSVLGAPLGLQPEMQVRWQIPTFVEYAMERLEEHIGSGSGFRGGLRIISTLDYDMQRQSECALQTHLDRMSGGDPSTTFKTADGETCLAASLLPPIRPGDVGVDHNIDALALVTIDPASGEILSLVGEPSSASSRGSILTGRPLGTAFYPFIYLAAFTQGFAPGTMVLDIPDETSVGSLLAEEAAAFQGPVSMRAALANAFPAATARTLTLAGASNVLRTAEQMGLDNIETDVTQLTNSLQYEMSGRLADVTHIYSTLGQEGQIRGALIGDQLSPVILSRVEDAAGQLHYEYQPDTRALLSPQLSYLMADTLSDETARQAAFGSINPTLIGRPAGIYVGETGTKTDNWAIGFTPSRAVGVWMGNLDGETMETIGPLNGALPLWHAIQRYTTQGLPPEAWPEPQGLSELEVCDPSGQLPTIHCPSIVNEIYIQGTEPTNVDTLFQPVSINKETGTLATLFTPIDLVEERVYMILPAEAAAWAAANGIEQPPQQYDLLIDPPAGSSEVAITRPSSFEVLRGEVAIEASIDLEETASVRLQFGEGLNPRAWVQIGEDLPGGPREGALAVWDTSGLNGLHILQLVIVLDDGRIETASIPLSLDNTPPLVEPLLPEDGAVLSKTESTELILDLFVDDNLEIDRVEYFLRDRRIATIREAPYSARVTLPETGNYQLYIRAVDTAGNSMDSAIIEFEVVP